MLHKAGYALFFLVILFQPFAWGSDASCASEDSCESVTRGCSCVVMGPCCQDRGCNYRSDYYHTTGHWATCDNDCINAYKMGKSAVWLPEGPPLFRPFIADPHEITYSVGWRFNDQVVGKDVIPVSFYDIFPIIRFCNVGPWHGQLQLSLYGAVWACFTPLEESAPLINADYYVGGHLTYAFDCWSFRFRGYHISSHLGDEFLIMNPNYDRRNPSAEYLDIFASNQFSREIRLYGGVGYIFHQDNSFKRSPFYAEAGVEVRLCSMGFVSHCHSLYGEPFYAMHWRYSSDFKNHVDLTYALGYEIGKLCGLGRKMRLYLEYHDGYSVEGQFSKQPTNYLEIKATYGF